MLTRYSQVIIQNHTQHVHVVGLTEHSSLKYWQLQFHLKNSMQQTSSEVCGPPVGGLLLPTPGGTQKQYYRVGTSSPDFFLFRVLELFVKRMLP
jgi:hypothetical protein